MRYIKGRKTNALKCRFRFYSATVWRLLFARALHSQVVSNCRQCPHKSSMALQNSKRILKKGSKNVGKKHGNDVLLNTKSVEDIYLDYYLGNIFSR